MGPFYLDPLVALRVFVVLIYKDLKKYSVIMTSSLNFFRMRKEMKTLNNISKSPCIKACTMVKKNSKYIEEEPILRKILKWLWGRTHVNVHA